MPTEILGQVKSHSNPHTYYDIKKGRDGVVYCDCMGWKMSTKDPKTCKHVEEFVGGVWKQPTKKGVQRPREQYLSDAIEKAIAAMKGA